MDEIEIRVIELIREYLGLELDIPVTLESFFVEDLGADSSGVTMLATAISLLFPIYLRNNKLTASDI